MTTYDQGLVPSICLSEKPVNFNGHVNGTANGTANGGTNIRLRSSSKSTSVLESEVSPRRKPAMMRSASDLGSEVKMDLGSETSILSSEQYEDDNSKSGFIPQLHQPHFSYSYDMKRVCSYQ